MNPHIFDLTHQIHPDMRLFPGTPPIQIERMNSIEKNGFNESRLILTSHAGTHVDAPAHLLANGRNLDEFPASTFWGKAYFLDCRSCGDLISREHLTNQSTKISVTDFLILVTGYSEKWPQESYLSQFPTLDPEAAAWIVDQKFKAVGIDTISIDPVTSDQLPIHQKLLQNEILIIENLKIPQEIIGYTLEMIFAPLKFVMADGAPVRVFVRQEERATQF